MKPLHSLTAPAVTQRADTGGGWPAWSAPLRESLRYNQPLAPFTTLKIGGPAEWYYPARTIAEFVMALNTARDAQVPTTLLGDGSNVLISDDGIRGLVIHNRCFAIARDGDAIYSEAGALLAALVERSRTEALTGLEFAAGIYGSVGGAVFGNAGAYGKSMQDVLVSVEVLTREGARRTVPTGQMGFAYRSSACAANGWTVLSCRVALRPGDGNAITSEVNRIISIRATKLPADLPSAGSYFKNIEESTAEYGKIPAGKLLEQVDAKSLRVGNAGVYERHANVIVNLGGATASDILALAAEMKRRVKERFGIELQSEVRFLGEPPTT
jgi:UDP-N-acetylmuramate dehydrogenase